MTFSDQHIRDGSDARTVARGREYFLAGRVTLDEVRNGFVRATVAGTEPYEVQIFEESGTIDAICTCPYFHEIYDCKHIVATKYALSSASSQPSVQSRKRPRQAAWSRAVLQMLRVPELPQPRSTHAQPWRLAYALVVDRECRRILPLRIKVLKNGSDGAATPLQQFNLYDTAHFDLMDRLIVSRIQSGFSHYISTPSFASEPFFSHRYVPSAATAHALSDLFLLLRSKEIYLAKPPEFRVRRLNVADDTVRMILELRQNTDALVVQPTLQSGNDGNADLKDFVILNDQPLWVLINDRIVQVNNLRPDQLHALRALDFPISIPARHVGRFLREDFPALASAYTVTAPPELVPTVDVDPEWRVHLREISQKLIIECVFRYGTIEISASENSQSTEHQLFVSDDKQLTRVVRRPSSEAEGWNIFLSASLEPFDGGSNPTLFSPSGNPLEWLLMELPKLRTAGFHVYGEESLKSHRLTRAAPRIGASVSSGIDWFDLTVDMRFEGTQASFDAFVKAIERKERFVRLDDGSYGILPERLQQLFRRALALGESTERGVSFSRAHVGLIDEVLDGIPQPRMDAVFQKLRERLRSFTSITGRAVPRTFHGTLRPYQRAGYSWLHFLRDFEFGGILADDMGLGKTVQTLAFLQQLYDERATAPTLIVVPTSLIFNWEQEAGRFTPGLRVYCHHGSARARSLDSMKSVHLIITSYGILRRDVQLFTKMKFLVVVLDESQNIKNPVSVNAKAAHALQAHYRLALTGTPVENNLTELWSQFSFLNPGMLGTLHAFTEHYARPIQKLQSEEAAASLRRLVNPFLLRRTKELVEKDLPEKQESVVYCDMGKDQRMAYDHWREYYRRAVIGSIERMGLHKSRFKVLEGLVKLRQVCCHPGLVDNQYHGSSGKFEAFVEMLGDVLSEGHKVLVFSQFVRMLTRLREHCERQGIVYEYLDGRTRDRRQRVERFQRESTVPVFLISLKAGGTGLNLTAADYVIHYDPWWNPAAEMQATDRAHRIGQTKPVFSYKLIMKETVEEKILALQEQKRQLARSIVTTETGFFKSLSREDIEALFS